MLAMKPSTPRGAWCPVSSLTTIASMLAPTVLAAGVPKRGAVDRPAWSRAVRVSRRSSRLAGDSARQTHAMFKGQNNP